MRSVFVFLDKCVLLRALESVLIILYRELTKFSVFSSSFATFLTNELLESVRIIFGLLYASGVCTLKEA